MKLPPDVDRLAWSVAESHDPKARAEFAHRYPEFAEEMHRRATLVDDRGATPAHAAAGIALPVRKAPVPMWASVLAGVAVGAVVLSLFIPRSEATGGADLSGPTATLGTVSGTRTASTSLPILPERTAAPTSAQTDIPPVSTASPERPAGNPNAEQTMRLEGTALRDALALIAAAGELRLQIDPDIPDPEVREEFTNLTPREMIARLGQEYGYRVVEESPGSLVLVPLDEPQAPQEEGDGGDETPAPTVGGGENSGSEDLGFPIFADGNR